MIQSQKALSYSPTPNETFDLDLFLVFNPTLLPTSQPPNLNANPPRHDKMCEQRETICKDCHVAYTTIKFCRDLKKELYAIQKSYNHKKCPRFVVTERKVDSFDRSHQCPKLYGHLWTKTHLRRWLTYVLCRAEKMSAAGWPFNHIDGKGSWKACISLHDNAGRREGAPLWGWNLNDNIDRSFRCGRFLPPLKIRGQIYSREHRGQ